MQKVTQASRGAGIASRSWYIHGLTRLLRDYIRRCPQCLALQTRRHRPYGALQPIQSPSTLDFILALPTTAEGFDSVITVTDKFFKRITYLIGEVTWKARDWAVALLDRLDIADWGLPMVLGRGESNVSRDMTILGRGDCCGVSETHAPVAKLPGNLTAMYLTSILI